MNTIYSIYLEGLAHGIASGVKKRGENTTGMNRSQINQAARLNPWRPAIPSAEVEKARLQLPSAKRQMASQKQPQSAVQPILASAPGM